MIDQEAPIPGPELDSPGPIIDLAYSTLAYNVRICHMNLKNQLQIYMNHNGLTAAKLAKSCGISKQVISLWLAGGSPRKMEQIKKVADHLGTTIDHLCFGNGLKTKLDEEIRSIPEDEWIGGVFEVKFRRVKVRSNG